MFTDLYNGGMDAGRLFSRYSAIIHDYKAFLEFIERPLNVSFRLNTLKARRDEILNLLKDFVLVPVPFYRDAFIVKGKVALGKHFTHQTGLIYGQEIASMVPVIALDPKPGETILDLCAAPGSKASQISQHMENTGVLVANEVNRIRLQSLLHNVKRCGVLNEAIVALPGEKIGNILPDYFDRVLLDAPCSVEGTIRKSKAVLYHWGLKNIQKMAWIQKGLAVSGFRALHPGGTMVYSTCTIAPEENEGVIDYLLKKFPEAEIMEANLPGFKTRSGITGWDKESFDNRVKNCARILPQDNDTAPFFIAKITKRGIQRTRPAYHGRIEFQNKVIEKFCQRFTISPDRFKGYAVFQSTDEYLISTASAYSFLEIKSIRKGLEIGKIYDNEIKPDNDFIQLFARKAEQNAVEVKDWELKRFLKGETIGCPSREEGFVIITFKNLPVGIGRANGREIKSSVHPERRIP